MSDHQPAPIVFLDTETTGLEPDDHVWEFAAIRREPDGTQEVFEVFVEHDLDKAAQLPKSFRADHDARYRPAEAIAARHLGAVAHYACRTDTGTPYAQRPHIVGAVPSFDIPRLEVILRRVGVLPPWHHHLIDAETLAVGWLRGSRHALVTLGVIPADSPAFPPPPWDSEDLSRAVGVDPDQFARHTALGDVQWAMALFDRVMGAPA